MTRKKVEETPAGEQARLERQAHRQEAQDLLSQAVPVGKTVVHCESREPARRRADLAEGNVPPATPEPPDSPPTPPIRTDPGWTEYVLSLLREEEQTRDGDPRVGGLERLAQLLIGELIRDEVTHFQGESTSGWSWASVTRRMVFLTPSGEERVFEEVADCSPDNAEAPYCHHPAAMASTRARARALRNALCLRGVVTAEEKGLYALPEQTGTVSETHLTWLGTLCSRLDINVRKYLDGCRLVGVAPGEIPLEKWKKIKINLSELQKEPHRVVETIRGYDPNWRSEQ